VELGEKIQRDLDALVETSKEQNRVLDSCLAQLDRYQQVSLRPRRPLKRLISSIAAILLREVSSVFLVSSAKMREGKFSAVLFFRSSLLSFPPLRHRRLPPRDANANAVKPYIGILSSSPPKRGSLARMQTLFRRKVIAHFPLFAPSQEIQKLRQRILREEQQLRAVSGPAYVAKDRDKANTEQSVSASSSSSLTLGALVLFVCPTIAA